MKPYAHINDCSSFFASMWRADLAQRFTFRRELLGRIWACR